MLTALDETLLHQAPITFDQALTSDHRFFDRMWLGGHCADNIRFISGLAAYKNTNTFDGYFAVYHDARQYNLRVSRPLLPTPADMRVGPLSVAIVRPLQELRLTLERSADHPLAAQIQFTATIPAQEEHAHLKRVDGRIAQDYCRFDQIGRANGWIEIERRRIEVDDWFSARDHSWGVRPGMGGYEPLTSTPRKGEIREDVGAGSQGFLLIWLAFETPSLAGYLQRQEDGEGRLLYLDGHVLRKTGGRFDKVPVVSVDHDLHFVEGTRVADRGTLTVGVADGAALTIEIEPLLPPICYKGAGYDGGYNDERGLGLHRGELLEFDIYDLSHVENVGLPDGRIIRPWHRESACTLRVNGETGLGHFPVINSGTLRRYGLSADATNRKAG